MARTTAIIIGTPALCERIERQLDLLRERPVTIGRVVVAPSCANLAAGAQDARAAAALGTYDDLDSIIDERRPDLVLLSLPAAMGDLIASIRTRLRRLGVAERFMPTLEDQLAGIGPRTHIDIDIDALIDRPPRAFDEQAVREIIGNKRVLITGAGGSIGGELARLAARFEPAMLILMERSENALFEIDRQCARLHPDLPRRAVLHDVVDAAATLKHFCDLRPHVIFHAAAHKHVPMMEDHPAAALENNFFGTKSVADAAAATGAERFVLISTDKAVNPSSIMGATKRLAEMYVQNLGRPRRATLETRNACANELGTAFSIVRFGNVLGSSGSVLEVWARQIADGGPVTVTDRAMTRYFMTIPEAAALVVQAAALARPGRGDVFLLKMGRPVRIVDLARRFIAMHGLGPLLPQVPDASTGQRVNTSARGASHGPAAMPIVYTGARPGEKIHEELIAAGDALRATGHPDVDAWELPAPDDAFVRGMLDDLDTLRRDAAPRDLAAALRRWAGGPGSRPAAPQRRPAKPAAVPAAS